MSETQLVNLKRKLIARRSKIEAMLFELQELNQKISKLQPDNSDVIVILKELSNKFDLFELKPNIQVESKEVNVKPNINVSPPEVNIEVNQESVIAEIQQLKEKINSKPNLETDKLITDLINKVELLELKPNIHIKPAKVKVEVNQESVIEEIKLLKESLNSNPNLKTNELLSDLILKVKNLDLKPIIQVEQKEVKVEPIFNPRINVLPTKVEVAKTDVKTPINWLFKSLENILSPLMVKITSFISKMLEYIKEPDRVVITDDEIIEYYGEKEVVYKINDDGRKMEIYRK